MCYHNLPDILPLHELIQITFAKQFGFAIYFAKLPGHFLRRYNPIAFPKADGTDVKLSAAKGERRIVLGLGEQMLLPCLHVQTANMLAILIWTQLFIVSQSRSLPTTMYLSTYLSTINPSGISTLVPYSSSREQHTLGHSPPCRCPF